MIKDILREGDLILFHTRGFSPISWGIRLLTESYWNHIGIYKEDIDLNFAFKDPIMIKKGYVIEALGRGISKTPIEKYIGNKNYILKVVRLREESFKNKEEYSAGIQIALERTKNLIGKKYDWWAIVWLGAVYLGKGSYKKCIKHLPIDNPLESRSKFFCSELVCQCYYKTSSLIENLFAGKYYPDASCSTITPKDCGKSKNVETVYGNSKLL